MRQLFHVHACSQRKLASLPVCLMAGSGDWPPHCSAWPGHQQVLALQDLDLHPDDGWHTDARAPASCILHLSPSQHQAACPARPTAAAQVFSV